jgi:hypothetical protein
MNITPAVDNLHVALMDPTGPVEWRPIAKDAVDMKGADLREAVQQIAIGETFDFEYRARGEQELRLEAWSPGSNQRPVQMLTFED